MGDRAQAVEVAAGSVGGAYYNMKLSDIVAIETEDPPALGYAAGDMLGPASGYRVENQGVFAELGRETGDVYAVGMDFSTDAFGRWRLGHNLCGSCETSVWREWGAFQAADTVSSPFFARAGGAVELQMQGNGVRPFAAFSGPESRRAPWRQLGLQWRHAQGGFDLVAEFSRIDESRSVWGTDFGALGRTRTETRRKRLFLSGPLKQNWRGFLSFERYSGDVSVNGGMLSGISGLRDGRREPRDAIFSGTTTPCDFQPARKPGFATESSGSTTSSQPEAVLSMRFITGIRVSRAKPDRDRFGRAANDALFPGLCRPRSRRTTRLRFGTRRRKRELRNLDTIASKILVMRT